MITHATACELIEGPGPALPELLARAGELRDRGRGRTRHLLGEGLRAAHHAVSRLLRLLHVPAGPRRAGRPHPEPRRGGGARAGRCDAWAPRRRCSRWATAGGALSRAPRVPRASRASHHARLPAGDVRAHAEGVRAPAPRQSRAHGRAGSRRPARGQREHGHHAGDTVRAPARRAGTRTTARPTRCPARRLRTIALAGKLGIPFTTGILIGIGETPRERVDALLAIRDLHERWGHIQEVIVQNFRAKPGIPMRGCARAHPRRPAAHAGGGPPGAGPRHEHPGAAQPQSRRVRAAAGRRAQRLGRRVAADPRSHQSREALARPARVARGHRESGLRASASGWPSIRSTRRAPSSSTSVCDPG